ncbi:MAG: hypothetical protein HY921_12100 [Elusimicrobia bacterium]|nr:hypothetical protein [Elusimicrobiota bacterium]
MANDMTAVEEDGGLGHLEDGEPGQSGRPEGRKSKAATYIKLQTYQPLKEAVTLDEIRLKYMKQGVDVSRSRLISEAIKLLAQAVSEGKFELRG